MYAATQNARHLQRREGSFSLVPSARGVNLLGWEEPEILEPEEQRKAIGRRVGQIQLFLHAHGKDIDGKQKWKLIKEMSKLVEKLRKLKIECRKGHVKDLATHFMDVARGRLTRAEYNVWINEARQRSHLAASAERVQQEAA